MYASRPLFFCFRHTTIGRLIASRLLFLIKSVIPRGFNLYHVSVRDDIIVAVNVFFFHDLGPPRTSVPTMEKELKTMPSCATETNLHSHTQRSTLKAGLPAHLSAKERWNASLAALIKKYTYSKKIQSVYILL